MHIYAYFCMYEFMLQDTSSTALVPLLSTSLMVVSTDSKQVHFNVVKKSASGYNLLDCIVSELVLDIVHCAGQVPMTSEECWQLGLLSLAVIILDEE